MSLSPPTSKSVLQESAPTDKRKSASAQSQQSERGRGRLSDIRGTTASDHLDLVRGVAALLVVYSHARVLFMKSAGPDVDLGIMDKGLYLMSGLGHQSVMVFFVLSGFFISSSVFRDMKLQTWSWKKYLVNRCTRLLVVLVPCLFLTVFWDSLGSILCNFIQAGNADTAIANISREDIELRSGVVVFLGNLTFLQTIFVPTLGSNTALWSLSNEFWYYMLFPCICLTLAPQTNPRKRLIWGALTIAILAFIGTSIASYFLVWLLGTLLCSLPSFKLFDSPLVVRMTLSVAMMGLASLLLGILLKRIEQGLAADFLVAILFSFCLYCVIHMRSTSKRGPYSTLARTLAGFSFSLYALHLPLLIFFRECFTRVSPWNPDLAGWSALSCIVSITLVYAFSVAYLTERHTSTVRNWILRKQFA